MHQSPWTHTRGLQPALTLFLCFLGEADAAKSPLRRYARWLGRMPDPAITTEVELVLQVGLYHPLSPHCC